MPLLTMKNMGNQSAAGKSGGFSDFFLKLRRKMARYPLKFEDSCDKFWGLELPEPLTSMFGKTQYSNCVRRNTTWQSIDRKTFCQVDRRLKWRAGRPTSVNKHRSPYITVVGSGRRGPYVRTSRSCKCLRFNSSASSSSSSAAFKSYFIVALEPTAVRCGAARCGLAAWSTQPLETQTPG